MILQKSYADLHLILDFFDKWHFCEMEIFCSITKVFDTFAPFNTSLNKIINF